MDVRHARTFVTVADLGTVSKAAVRLGTAQPALSRQIGDLEKELGLKLFDRIGRRLRLTGAGEQLLKDCRALLSQASAVGERARILRQGDTGVLRVAASPQFIESVIAAVLPAYVRRNPNVDVKFVEAVGQENFALVERGEIHLGQNLFHAVTADNPRFASYPLGPVQLFAAGLTLPPNIREVMEIGHLATYPLLLLESGFSVRHTFDAACRLAGVKPNIVFEGRAPHTLFALAKAGHGVAIIPSTLRIDSGGLHLIRVTYRRRAGREPLIFIWDKRRPLPPYAMSFCEMCRAHVRKIT
jgi:DNA-binding transcriptional LysR family regulator